MVYQETHRYDEALDCYTQGLAIKRKLGDQEGEASTLHQFGMVHEETHRYDEALDYYNQSLAIERELGNRETRLEHSTRLDGVSGDASV